MVIEKLQCNWSPRQISGYLIEQFPDDASMRVSAETIYRSLFIQARGVLKKDLIKHLRTGRRICRAKAASARLIPAHGQILDAVRISQRPAEVEDRAVPGHWQGDLHVGSKHAKIATLVERQTRYVMLVKMPADDSKSIVDALARTVQKLPAELGRGWPVRGRQSSRADRLVAATRDRAPSAAATWLPRLRTTMRGACSRSCTRSRSGIPDRIHTPSARWTRSVPAFC